MLEGKKVLMGTLTQKRSGIGGLAFSVLLLVWLAACSGADPTPAPIVDDWQDATLAPLTPTLKLTPTVAGLGQTLPLQLKSLGFEFDETSIVSLGDGVEVLSVQQVSASELALQVGISPDTTPGYRTVSITTGGVEVEQPQALLLQLGALQVSPSAGIPGQLLDVNVAIDQYIGENGYTWIDFGEGISTESFTLSTDGTQGVARIRIDSQAPIGARTVSLQDGPTRIQLPDGFLVDRGLIAVTFDPPNAKQGETVDFVITGYNTHFDQALTTVDLGLGVLIDLEDPTALVVESPTRITGKMQVCEAAVVGYHDVIVTTTPEQGPPEQLTAIEGFSVTEVPLGVDRARGSFSLTLAYTMRDGVITASVGASANFFASVSGCATYVPGTSCPYTQPQPDVPQFNPPLECNPTPAFYESPPSPTFDAGEAVFFETDGVSIRLDRSQDDDGTISYTSKSTIPLESYKFGAPYSIRATGGSGTQAIAAFTAKDVLYPLNASFFLTSPDLRDTPTLDRYDSIEVTWEDEQGQPGAQTFPTAAMSGTLRTVDADTLLSRSIDLSILTDDGYAVYPADMISQLPIGPGLFQLRAIRPGVGFTLPGSSYVSTPGSGVYYTGYFELRE